MKKLIIYLFVLLSFCLNFFPLFAQEAERIEMDASSLTAGEPFRFTVTVNSDELRSFMDVQARLTAVLCPAEQSDEECRIMNMTADGEESTSLRITFEADELPLAGDYTLDISFLDETGGFETKTAAYMLRGVQPSAASLEAAEPVQETAADQVPVSAAAEETETPFVPAAAEETETPFVPAVVKKVTLRPEILSADGSPLIYGSTVYVDEPYTLRFTFDSPLNDSVVFNAALPASMAAAPVDPACECASFLNADGTALRIPGGLWTEGHGNSLSCELRFNNNAWLAAQPIVYTLEANPVYQLNESYSMDPLNWTNYPVNITRFTATHQLQVSDSRGNLICSDTVPCAVFNAEDVYVMTYKFPADWGAAVPSGKSFSASINWPEAWAQGIRMAADWDTASLYGSACMFDESGKTTLSLEETAPGRYSASCTFVPGGIANPTREAAVVHLENNAYAVTDLNVWMPATIKKTQAVLTPSLTMRMTEESAAVEQIRGGTLGTLYRTTSDYPNAFDGFGKPALYTLSGEVSGIAQSRMPQYGDYIVVKWPLLDQLAAAGDLPSCLMPIGDGYILGNLEQTADGNWYAQCDFRFPQTMAESINGSTMEMDLLSGMYQTSAKVQMNGNPFKREPLVVNLDIPEHMLLRQPTEFHIDLTDGSGNFSDYLKAILSDTGVSIYGDWLYNYTTTCQGNYAVSLDGKASCSAYFDQPIESESDMHFELISSALDHLLEVEFRPSADLHIQPITPVEASLTVKLFHSGTEESLPAFDSDSFMVGDDYQLQFYLTPSAEYRDVLNAVSVDSEGMVLDWWEPLLIRWSAIPGGQTSMNFYRDGDHFIARYDFSFSQGNLLLEGNASQLVMEPAIEGWNISVQGNMLPIQLPGRVEKKPLTLSISDFTVEGVNDPLQDLHVNEEATFTVSFEGDLQSFDPNQLLVGYDANGIRTPLPCVPDFETGTLLCSIIPQCTDYSVGEYAAVCGTDLSLYAVYNGDPVNQATESSPKTFSVKRNELSFTSAAEGSLSADDLHKIQAAGDDLQAMGDGAMVIGGWNVDSFLPRQIRDRNGMEYCSYPVIFNYQSSSPSVLDENKLSLDVTYMSGTGSLPIENKISLKPRMVTDDTVLFELDFGSFEMLDDGRTVQNALEDAVAIKDLTIRYAGDQLLGAASAKYEAENLTFVLKVATLLELELDLSMPNTLRFAGIAASETVMQPFTVYCSQLYQPLGCSSDAPLEGSLETEFAPEIELSDDMTPEEITEALENWGSETATLGFRDDGCWGNLRIQTNGMPLIYVNNVFAPKCYLTAWNENRQIWIAESVD